MISRRDFLQATAVAAALTAGSGLGPLGRAAAQQKLSQADILRFEPQGQVTILHVADIHAQLMPLQFREPAVNLGVGEVKLTGMVRPDRKMLTYYVNFTKAVQTRRLTMGVADGVVEADGEVIYEVKDMKVALSES